MDYKGDGLVFNVGINYLTSDIPLWYALPDVIASKILTGKAPHILEAIRFVPKGKQPGLTPTEILGIPIDPARGNLIQLLVEERQKIKKRLKELPEGDPEHAHLSSKERAMKILVNAMSYGIFIELNPDESLSDIEVFGLDHFTTDESRYERPGRYFHPILGVLITAGSRLFLAMAEAKTRELGAHHAYMDTDSIFVPPEHAPAISAFFQPLNPYKVNIPLLKPDKENLQFYGICSKRYALYRFENGKILFMETERSFKLHGLGHLTNPFQNLSTSWQEEIWRDLLMLHYRLVSSADIEQKYANRYAVSRLTISTSHLLHRFKVFNRGRTGRR